MAIYVLSGFNTTFINILFFQFSRIFVLTIFRFYAAILDVRYIYIYIYYEVNSSSKISMLNYY